MAALADLRPPAVDALFRPGATLTVTLTWPAGELAGRAFTATLGGAALSVTESGDDLLIEASAAITGAVTEPAEWLLLEDGEAVMVGTWAPSDRPNARTATTLTVTVGAVDVDVTVGGVSASALAAVQADVDDLTATVATKASDADLTVAEGRITAAEADITALESGKVDVAGDTMTGPLGVTGDITLTGGVRSGHDALYKWGADFRGNAAEVDTDCPRWSFAADADRSIHVVQEMPTTWTGTDRAFTARLAWTKEAAGTGDVVWQFSYRFVWLVDGNFLGAKTVVTPVPKAVPGSIGGFSYHDTFGTNIPIAAGPFFGDAPQVVCTVTRLTSDVRDTYAGAASAVGLFFQRIDL